MTKNFFVSLILVFTCTMTISTAVLSSTTDNALDSLLTNLKLGQDQERQIHIEREHQFVKQRDQQKQLLAEQKRLKKKLEQEYASLKQDVKNKNQTIEAEKASLEEATHHLKDLFSLARQVAQDNHKEISNSITSQQYPELTVGLAPLTKNDHLPSSIELKALWLSLLNEIKASEEVTQFNGHYYAASGDKQDTNIIRAGPFSAFTDSQYLVLSDDGNSLSALQKSPQITTDISSQGQLDLLIDPTRGQLFKTLEREKSLLERIEQGGIVGSVIIALGLLGILVTLVKLVQLSMLNGQIKKQLANPATIESDNPLGRVLAVGQEHSHSHPLQEENDKKNNELQHNVIQSLEIKLNEAIMKEAPHLDKGSGFIKLLATVAPLLGLLGTVTGMIATFQAITLFGAGDPKLMAGGISQALVTTVLGLVVAIPLLFGHNMVVHRARSLLVVLSQESLALVAQAIETPKQEASSHQVSINKASINETSSKRDN